MKNLENFQLGMNTNEEKRSRHINNFFRSTTNKGRNNNIDQDKCSPRWSGMLLTLLEMKPFDIQLEQYMEALDSKRGSTREWALHGLVEVFEKHVLYDFVENKSVTLSTKFIYSLKRGSLAEVLLACRALGLLVLTDGYMRNAHEIMEYAIPPLSQALRHKSEAVVAVALRTLSILTFVGSHDVREIERTMKIMWETINPNLSPEVKIHPTVLVAGVSSWSLLLSAIDGWQISSTLWKGAIHFFCRLLYMDAQSIRVAAGQAISLILDTDRLYKFFKEDDFGCSNHDYPDISSAESLLRDAILRQFKSLLLESEKIDFADVPAELLKIFIDLKTMTWSQQFQFDFLRDYLGDAYVKHMLENELFHDIFDYVEKSDSVAIEQLHVDPFFNTTKERTVYRNKQRCAAKGKREGHFAVEVDVRA